MSFLAASGFITIGLFLGLILFTRLPVLAALVLIPVAGALSIGAGSEIGKFAIDGMRAVAPVATMILFAILYFGMMLDAGLFEPMVQRLLRLVRDDPVRLCLVTAILPMFVALDGDGSTTFLISISALLPIHRRMGINPLVLPAIVALAAGVMNILPWGGPTARATAALNANVSQIFEPVIPAMLAGIGWVLVAAFVMGFRERRRLAKVREDITPPLGHSAVKAVSAPDIRLLAFNAILTLLLIVLLFQGLYAKRIGMAEIHPALLFMAAFAIAFPVNRRTAKSQQEQLSSHAASAVLVVSMILAAGIFTGILGGTGMIKAMAQVLANQVSPAAAPWLSTMVALASMPLSLVFTPDAFYFGILPILADTAATAGQDPLSIGRAAILGQMTTGFPLSPLTASTFILIGLSEVTLRDHQRFVFKWAFGTTVVMTLVASLTGAF